MTTFNRPASRAIIAVLLSLGITSLYYALTRSSLRNFGVVALEPAIHFVHHFDANCFGHKYCDLEVLTANFLIYALAILLLLRVKDYLLESRKSQQSNDTQT